MQLRQLTTIDEFRRVTELEHEVWGYTSSEDAVPVPILIVSVKVGGILLGAFDEKDGMVGFAYALPGVRDGRAFQWSHMLGVRAGYRDRGVGWQLKIEQRRLTLAMGLDLIQWTYDPLQALNAHLNFTKLGVVTRKYELDVYGDSTSPLHHGTPTDRFIAEWWIRSPRVKERLDGQASEERASGAGWVDAPPANVVSLEDKWVAPGRHDLSIDAPRIRVVMPMGFTSMQLENLPLAQAWRACTREIFTTYLSRGYEVCDFALDRAGSRGTYLLRRNPE